MKHVASKSSASESQKTPGGISKSLLTPCRRVGLSRNWKKAGPSPFVSPLSGSSSSNIELKLDKKGPRKRKERIPDEGTEDCSAEITKTPESQTPDVDEESVIGSSKLSDNIVSTPTGHISLPRKKKSRILTECRALRNVNTKIDTEEIKCFDEKITPVDVEKANKSNLIPIQNSEVVTTPIIRQKSLSNSKNKISSENFKINNVIEVKENKMESKSPTKEVKQRSPNNLTKECVVVIQKKIFKTDKKGKKDLKNVKTAENELQDSKTPQTKELDSISQDMNSVNQNALEEKSSQVLFDSDSDDVPLSHMNKEKKEIAEKTALQNSSFNKTTAPQNDIINLDEDDDFAETQKMKVLKHENTKKPKQKLKPIKSQQTKKETKLLSNSFEDDDDFEFETKKTILIRKTYEKVSKPVKAKTTGSITQKDIDELKERIEMKKKLLLAKVMTEETKELRDLIKRWQRGCQDALMELMDLMKTKCPDRNMDYGQMLEMLKIPTQLVGYDEDNDCFVTPNDADVILSEFNTNNIS